MECKHWNENWVAYLYDECSPAEHDAVEAHLDSCVSCREQMDSLAATRRAMESSASEIVAPPRVIILPTAPRRAPSAWSFAGGFAAAAAMFAIGIFIGVSYFSSERVLLETNGAEFDLTDPVATNRSEPAPDTAYQQVRNDYEQLDNRIESIENWLPARQGETLPAIATMDRVQTAVGDLNQQFDLRRAEDLRFVVEWILATDQDSRLRDARTLQALGVVHAESNPNVRQR